MIAAAIRLLYSADMKKSQLIVALDVPNSNRIPNLIDNLPEAIEFYKVGLELFCAEGPAALDPVRARNKKIFLDLKLHDIPRTVERAVQSASRHGVQMLTIHASGGRAMMQAAAASARETGLALLAVTALTSLDQNDLKDLGIARTPSDHVLNMAELALSSGVPGLVCSPHEIKSLRARFGDQPILVTPGIRLPTNTSDDQKRVGAPREAVRDGASFLVVGRPILEAKDPRAAALAMLNEIDEARRA
jgi:orotidine-5'-phosphate decarboxylase